MTRLGRIARRLYEVFYKAPRTPFDQAPLATREAFIRMAYDVADNSDYLIEYA